LAFTTQEIGALQDLILLLHAAWEVYDELCRHRRVMDFIAAEEAALRLLEGESPGELLLRLDWRLQHILVDEFQDTSDNQKGLLCRLLAGWEAGDGRTLTVVGDPKQSIYGWRQARLRLFLESREGLRCGGGQTWPLAPLSLTTNFRATERLIHWVNGVFGETVMADAQAAGGLIFQPADPPPGQREGADPVLALFAGEDREAGRRAEARWLAQQVAEAQEELPAGEQVALLLFARTHLTTYLGAFQEIGLVPRVKEGLKLADSRVVQHLHNLARALVRPQDDVAWATLLAGPWVRPDLVSLAAGARTPGVVWPEKLLTWAGTDACPPELAGLINNLHRARERVGREPLVDTVERLLGEVGGWEGLAAWEGALGVAGVRAYLRLLAGADLGLPEGTFEKADFALEGAYLPPDPRAEDSRVEVLTVHGAKGLEFHTVFLPYLDWRALGKGGGQPPFLLEEIPGTGTHALALAPPQWQKRARSSFTLVQNLHNARLLAEARRVFYVAVTRARERLFLSGVLTAKGGGWAAPAASPLSWLRQHYRGGELPEEGESACWEPPPLQVHHWADYPEASPRSTPLLPQPCPWEFIPESPAYGFSYPSREAVADPGEEGARPRAAGLFREGDNQVPRVRGEVTHRLLETLVRGAALPREEAVAAALRTLGLTRETAARLAPDLLAEVQSCSLDPFLGGLLASGETTPEWFLEDRPAPGVIRRGRLDLLAWDGQEWWLVDFKTSRPPSEEDWEGFVRREAEKYRPQLLAYREMAARAKGIEPPEVIRVGVYFTAWRKVVEV
jgi:ATP-dependent exoDNAse (exonuclease V) beta subunit